MSNYWEYIENAEKIENSTNKELLNVLCIMAGKYDPKNKEICTTYDMALAEALKRMEGKK